MRFIFFITLFLMPSLAFAQHPTKTPSKISYPVQMEIEHSKAERSAGVKALSNGEDAAVRVSEDGEILLVFHSIAATGSEQSKQLEALGARVVYVLETPSVLLLEPVGMIHAWVPIDMVEVQQRCPG